MALKIRPASPRDAAALSLLVKQLGFPSSPREVVQRLKRVKGSTLVATHEGEVVGLITISVMRVLHRPTPVGRLSALVVAKGARGKGVGRALVKAAENRLKARGCGLVEVTSNLRLKDAHAFYRRLGYEATSLRFKKAT